MLKTCLSVLFIVLILPIGLMLSGCTPEVFESPASSPTPATILEGTLRPYPTFTPTITPFPTDYVTPTPSPTVTPTATQVFYEVQQGDDMGSIGWRYKVSVEAIKTANPNVDPRAMSIGTMLLIPITPVPEPTPAETAEVSPTPGTTELLEPNCFPEALGGLWCFALVENNKEGALENVTGRFTLQWGENSRFETAIMPLNLLPEGRALPLLAYFQPPIPANYTILAEVEFSLPVMPEDERYLEVEIVEQTIRLGENSEVAQIALVLSLPEGQPSEYLWVNATGFDQSGHIVAVRRWISQGELPPGERVEIELVLYSLEGMIDRVDILTEARTLDILPNEEGGVD